MTGMQCRIAAFVLGVACAAASPSKAGVLAFTWNPAGASPSLDGSAFSADTIVTKHFLTDISQPDGTASAHQIAVVTGFSLGGSAVSPAGFGTAYGLYLDITDTHTSGPPPEIIRFSSINVSLKADPGNRNGAALATASGAGFANTGPTGQADDITLATGSRVASLTNLNVATGVLDAFQLLTLQASAGEAGFFSSPALNGSVSLQLQNSNLANFTSIPQPDGTSITVFANFDGTAQLVPEPGSIMVLTIGLLVLLPFVRRGWSREVKSRPEHIASFS